MKAPSFPLYVNNWIASRRILAMTPEQEGGYIHLLCHAWNSPDCSVPDDDEMLAVLSRLGDKWATVGGKIRACFYKNENGNLVNERLLKCWNENKAYRERQAKDGMAGAKARYGSAMATLKQPHSSESESESESELELEKLRTCLKIRLGKLYHRRDTTPWQDKELRRLREIADRPDAAAEMGEIEALHTAMVAKGEERFFKHDIFTLLNNWTVMLDRARASSAPVSTPDQLKADTDRAIAEALK